MNAGTHPSMIASRGVKRQRPTEEQREAPTAKLRKVEQAEAQGCRRSTHIQELCTDLLSRIMGFLETNERHTLRQVSKQFCNAANNAVQGRSFASLEDMLSYAVSVHRGESSNIYTTSSFSRLLAMGSLPSALGRGMRPFVELTITTKDIPRIKEEPTYRELLQEAHRINIKEPAALICIQEALTDLPKLRRLCFIGDKPGRCIKVKEKTRTSIIYALLKTLKANAQLTHLDINTEYFKGSELGLLTEALKDYNGLEAAALSGTLQDICFTDAVNALRHYTPVLTALLRQNPKIPTLRLRHLFILQYDTAEIQKIVQQSQAAAVKWRKVESTETPGPQKSTHIQELPLENLTHIMRFLGTKERGALRQVSRQFCTAVNRAVQGRSFASLSDMLSYVASFHGGESIDIRTMSSDFIGSLSSTAFRALHIGIRPFVEVTIKREEVGVIQYYPIYRELLKEAHRINIENASALMEIQDALINLPKLREFCLISGLLPYDSQAEEESRISSLHALLKTLKTNLQITHLDIDTAHFNVSEIGLITEALEGHKNLKAVTLSGHDAEQVYPTTEESALTALNRYAPIIINLLRQHPELPTVRFRKLGINVEDTANIKAMLQQIEKAVGRNIAKLQLLTLWMADDSLTEDEMDGLHCVLDLSETRCLVLNSAIDNPATKTPHLDNVFLKAIADAPKVQHLTPPHSPSIANPRAIERLLRNKTELTELTLYIEGEACTTALIKELDKQNQLKDLSIGLEKVAETTVYALLEAIAKHKETLKTVSLHLDLKNQLETFKEFLRERLPDVKLYIQEA